MLAFLVRAVTLSLFCCIRLDKKGQGFITTHEWGSDDYEKQLSDFARLYIQKTRGADGRYKGAQEVGGQV